MPVQGTANKMQVSCVFFEASDGSLRDAGSWTRWASMLAFSHASFPKPPLPEAVYLGIGDAGNQ